MSYYWDSKFLQHIDNSKVKITFEVGARYGDESIQLKKTFKNSIIYSFECNPRTIDTCKLKLSSVNDIIFNDFGLGEREENLPFYSYTKNNDGGSSFLKRIDFNQTQIQSGIIKVRTLENYVKEHNIQSIDLLCMDVQGYEMNVLKGAGEFIKKINYIIMEEPKPIINTKYLADGIHSKYISAPSSKEINEFMTENGFIEIERVEENKIEDNVMYKNIRV